MWCFTWVPPHKLVSKVESCAIAWLIPANAVVRWLCYYVYVDTFLSIDWHIFFRRLKHREWYGLRKLDYSVFCTFLLSLFVHSWDQISTKETWVSFIKQINNKTKKRFVLPMNSATSNAMATKTRSYHSMRWFCSTNAYLVQPIEHALTIRESKKTKRTWHEYK